MNVKFIPRSKNPNLWSRVLEKCDFFSIFYENCQIEYQIEYYKFYKIFYKDVSKIIFFNEQPVAVWPITIINSKKIDSFGQPIFQPAFVRGISKKIKRAVIKNCFEYVNNFCLNNKIKNWFSQDNFSNSFDISEWHIYSAKTQAQFKISYELYCNLSLKFEDIKACFRKSYKNIINNSINKFNIRIIDNKSEDKEIYWDLFTKLHLKVSKKKTKSKKAWDILYGSLENNKSFLLCSILKETNSIIAMALFNFNKDLCYYGIGVYDFENYRRKDSQLNLGHIIQYKAIEEMKKRNFLWYHIGNRTFNKILNKSQKRLEDIAYFKEGFSTHLLPHYLIKHNIAKNVE